jgi:hypothetical protein
MSRFPPLALASLEFLPYYILRGELNSAMRNEDSLFDYGTFEGDSFIACASYLDKEMDGWKNC